MLDWLVSWWHLCLDYYHVNPVVFLCLYVPKTFVYYWTIFHLVRALQSKNFVKVPALVICNVSTNISPWLYVYWFGDNLPWWYSLWFLGVLLFTFVYLAWSVRKRMLRSAEQTSTGLELVEEPALEAVNL